MPLVIRTTLYILFSCALSACASTDVSTNSSAAQIVIRGVVTEIFPTGDSQATSDWGVTVYVESVESGTYSQPEFTFSVHSPSLSGLVVGGHYTIVATASKVGFKVEESQWMKRGEAKW